MNIKKLPQSYPVTAHTDHVSIGGTFVAVSGHQIHGKNFIKQALDKGASCIVIETQDVTPEVTSWCTEYGAQLVLVDNARQTLATLAAQALNYPAKKLKIIGITGTKGKTTTAYLVFHILRQAGYRVGLLGTINNHINDHVYHHPLTTPDSDYLHMFFAECVNQAIDIVVMEASSHAKALHRTDGIQFDALAFTNLGIDHLDFHKTMENYYQTKLSLVEQLKPDGLFVTNTNNEWGKRALREATQYIAITPVGIGSSAENTIIITHQESPTGGVALTCSLFNIPIKVPALIGSFNEENVGIALALCMPYNISEKIIQQACFSFQAPPGRLEEYHLSNGARAFVDFAHVPMALEGVLQTLRPLTSHLIVLFGCGGNRDRTKRPLMGEIAARYADLVIISDDNPRSENRLTIINEIVAGIHVEAYDRLVIIPHRPEAVAYAVSKAQSHSIIALCGKGHEEYYLIDGTAHYWSDREALLCYQAPKHPTV